MLVTDLSLKCDICSSGALLAVLSLGPVPGSTWSTLATS